MIDEQPRHSQKYSVVMTLDELRVGSLSRRKSRPSLKYRNEAEHEGLLHLATINATIRVTGTLPSLLTFPERYGDHYHASL
jgi:hypothetical protein